MTTKSINKRHLAIFGVIALTSILMVTGFSAQDVQASEKKKIPKGCTGEKVSVTVPLDQKLNPGEVMVLLDTTGQGFLCSVHVAANLPCDKPTAGAANDTPEVVIIAGIAGVTIPPGIAIINDADDDTGFVGPNKTCVFHDTVVAPHGAITDIVIGNFGADKSKLKGSVVTITGTYSEGGLVAEVLK